MAYEALADKWREVEDNISRNTNYPPTPPQQQSPDLPPLDENIIQKPISKLAEKITFGNPTVCPRHVVALRMSRGHFVVLP